MKRLLVAMVCLFVAAFSGAQTFTEQEPNNTFATANVLSYDALPPFAITGDPTLTANDVDYFLIHLVPNTAVSVAAQPLNSATSPAVLMGLFDGSASHTLLRSSDSNSGAGAAFFTYRVATEGNYYIGVTGVGETATSGGFTGTHSQAGGYQLTVSVSPTPTPEPASFLALGVGAVALVRRKKQTRR